jgi:pyruvate-formate lyase-activating enzyme
MLSEYLIIPNSAFENETIKKEFLKFLKLERNEEPLLFLESVNEYKKENEPLKKIEKLQQIMKTYLNDDSARQINIGYLEKQKFKTNHQNYNEENIGDNEKNILDEVFLKK